MFVLASRAGPPTRVLLTCLAAQAVAATLIAFACWRTLPARYRSTRAKGAYCYLWLFVFAVPVGGALVSVGAMVLALALPRRVAAKGIAYIEEPEFATHLIPHVSYGRGARLKAELQNAEAATSLRMTALLAMQSMPAHTISPLLRGMLADPLDDIRLLAYGMLDSQEKRLTQRILAERPRLAKTLTPRERYQVNKTLAELYGELIYAHLVQGDVYRNAAEQADAYAAAALDIEPADAALWRMRGRLALDRGDLDAADTLLERAIQHGFARDRMLPYLAEAAYLRGDFARVKTLLGQMSPSAVLPVMKPVLDYWRGSLATLRKGV
ncbi:MULTISPECIES: lipopolysaccharide N-acetylglucosaminyl transferase [unclassified Caballeronia]|uniref:lipopolysaccharide N-acetylglucosaminyl transferase n=1 Tax=unclassified Caballeronia TaxID=2646786 RepID=UPI0038577F27